MLRRLDLKGWLQLLTCGLGSFAIFYVLFCRASFYDAFIEAMDVSNTQFGVLYGVYGWIAVVGYLIGGFVADKVAPRYLMFISYLVTGLCNFVLGFWPNYTVCLVLYAVMGVSTTVTYWDAMLKCNRILARRVNAEGEGFSWLQTIRGLGELTVSSAIIFGFTLFVNRVAGLRFVIWTYAAMLIVFAIISLFVFDDGKVAELDAEEKAKKEAYKKWLAEREAHKVLIPEQGHYEDVYESVKIRDAWDEEVDDPNSPIYGDPDPITGERPIIGYNKKTVHHEAEYQNVKTGTRWVIDVPAHYEYSPGWRDGDFNYKGN